MRGIFVCLCALALTAPTWAQEKMPDATASTPTVSSPTSPGKTGLFSRKSHSRNQNTTTVMTTPSTGVGSGTTTSTTTTEPIYNRHGKMIGTRSVQTKTSTTVKPAEGTKAETTTGSATEGSSTAAAKVTDSKVVQAGAVEPTPEPKKGFLSKIFKR